MEWNKTEMLVKKMLSDPLELDGSLELRKDLGLSSVDIMEMIAILETETEKEVNIGRYLQDQTVKGLLDSLE